MYHYLTLARSTLHTSYFPNTSVTRGHNLEISSATILHKLCVHGRQLGNFKNRLFLKFAPDAASPNAPRCPQRPYSSLQLCTRAIGMQRLDGGVQPSAPYCLRLARRPILMHPRILQPTLDVGPHRMPLDAADAGPGRT